MRNLQLVRLFFSFYKNIRKAKRKTFPKVTKKKLESSNRKKLFFPQENFLTNIREKKGFFVVSKLKLLIQGQLKPSLADWEKSVGLWVDNVNGF